MQAPTIQPWAVTREMPAAVARTRQGADALASQFEQVLLRQWLSQVRASSDADGSPVSAAYLEMADDHLASIVASVGGLGIATSVRRWMQGVQAYQSAAQEPAR